MAPKHENFIITYSKWKVWTVGTLIFLFLMIPLGFTGMLFILMLIDELSVVKFFLLLSPLLIAFLWLCSLTFRILKHTQKPLCILTPENVSAGNHTLSWTPQTAFYPSGRFLCIENPTPAQSRMSRFLWAPKNALIVHSPLVKETRQDVLKAIERLCPYPIKQTTFMALSKRQ